MRARHIEVTASGQIAAGQVQTAEGVTYREVDVIGFSFTGFTAVKLHDGTSTTDPVVISVTSPGVYSWNYELFFQNGCYAEVTGTGTLSVWLA